MVGFTNICAIELLDEQLAHLRSILTAQQREDIMYDYGMTVEQRIQVLQSSRDTYELKQSELPNRLEEAEKKVNDHAKQKNKQDVIKQKRRIIDFSDVPNKSGGPACRTSTSPKNRKKDQERTGVLLSTAKSNTAKQSKSNAT
ncbi:uncharacterized protein J4E84_006929 [Alternaria hordeiaustralica]|uniref:uncharacterized protein n=1 Tax=Alternaria hordeiaustralica TaxID=1187925 RepID=UPI0020C2B630|nr:uncharacterized protein J4E84_006929 [Alternaria hordeiaustralica]KAI4683027.1 hypothetical protein J4E84_006929 [Alternaria hordeiaustralica]